MGTPPIFLAGTQGERIKSDTSISLCGLPLFFVGTLLVAPKLPAMLRGTARGGGGDCPVMPQDMGEVEMYSAFAPYSDFISDTEGEG